MSELLLLLLRMSWWVCVVSVRVVLVLWRVLLQLVGWDEFIAALSVLSHREVLL